MADNNLARSRNDVPDFFADGDPLAELARIVGYEERVVAQPDPLSAPVSAPRREPVFNLEDELLREFEQYDAPRLDPVDDVRVDAPAPSNEVANALHSLSLSFPDPTPVDQVEAEPRSPEPVVEPEPVAEFVEEQSVEQPAAVAYEVTSEPVAEPEWSYAPAEHSAYEQSPAAVEPEQAEFVQKQVELAPEYAEPVVEEPAQPIAPAAIDLADELETSIVAEPVIAAAAASPVAIPAERVAKAGYVPSFRMPLANFQPAGRGVELEPAVARVVPAAPVEPKPSQAFTAWDQPAASLVPTQAPTAPVVPSFETPSFEASAFPAMNIPLAGPAEPVRSEPVMKAAPALEVPAAEKSEPFSALDELLYDVDRYSRDKQQEPAAAAAPVAPQPVEPKVEPVAPAIEPVVQAPVAKAAPAVEEMDPFSDVEFELALDELELDLAGMVVEENTSEQAKPAVAPVVVAAQPAPVAPAPVQTAAPIGGIPVPAYTAASAQIGQQPVDDVEEELAFDPALIADSEEQPEAIAELDVPALPVTEVEEAPAYRNDYDLDIDAELASLLEQPEPAPARRGEVAAAPQQAAAPVDVAKAQDQSVYADLDDFERALEEDFRRSLATPLAVEERYSASENYEPEVDAEQGSNSTRRWIAPLAAVGILAVCGAGAYAWFSSSIPGGAGANGEPIVIAADSDPVKVAPTNPGGKTVPNQDKAVYDRVAGSASETPRQEQLISSSEEPVDVVQRTLMPENIGMQGEEDVEMTEVSDTSDPRLLPNEVSEAPQAAEQQPVSVMPRKVKTMIVRADGKLVEQETIVPATAAAAPSAPAPAAASAASVKSEILAAADQSQSAAPFPTAPQAQNAAAPAASAPTDVASAASALPSEAQAPSAIEQLADTSQTASVRAPVPNSRPSQQPVNVVASVSDQGNVRPSATPAAPAAQAPAAPAAAAEGGYVIQIASLPSQADAQRSYQNLSNKFSSVIGGRGVDIKAAEIAGKGTFYRVRIPAGSSRAEAVQLCERYRSAGGSCIVAR